MKTRENYNDIFLFMTVAEMGNFTQAAKRLDMAQSNISRAVSGLEERLGVRLIVRSTRKIALT
ncbi:MAG: LysR family transcriptional regulator, partial [Neisseriaceae bacterium]|nr:LysR family transcriptional regulator [Neisseriaceae bacterium]